MFEEAFAAYICLHTENHEELEVLSFIVIFSDCVKTVLTLRPHFIPLSQPIFCVSMKGEAASLTCQ